MEAIAQRPAAPPNRMVNLALIILATVALWAFSPVSPAALALLAVAALFFFGLKRPVWALAALLVSQLTITSYMVGTPFGFEISLRLLILILTGLVLWRAFAQKQIDLGPKVRWVLIPAAFLLALSVIANLVNSGFDYAFKDFRNVVGGLLIVIFLPAVTRNLKELKILCGVAFIAITASAVIGLMQYYQFAGMSSATIIPGFLETANRIPGMAETELELSYVLSVAIIAVIGIFIFKGVNTRNKRLLAFSLLPMGLALYFTYTRSAIFALFLGLLALLLFLKTRVRGEILLLFLLIVMVVVATTGLIENISLGGRDEGSQQESSISRKILWQAGFAIALDNPILGIGGDQYKNVSPQYASSVEDSLLSWEEDKYWGYTTLGSEAIHNDFLDVWVSYGTLALFAYLWLYIAVLRNFLDSYKTSQRRFIKGLSIGLAAGLVAYGVNAFYHNCLATLPLFWILAGFSLASVKLALGKPKNHRAKEVATTS